MEPFNPLRGSHLFHIYIVISIVSLTQFHVCIAQATGNSADVLIVGAGMSGLGAATKLTSKGIKTIVLEARDRVGGRTWTVYTDQNVPIDLGASWIHGVKGNPVATLAAQAHVALSSKKTNYNNDETYYADGSLVPDSVLNQMDALWSQWQDYLIAYRSREYDVVEDPGLQSAVDDFIKTKNLSGDMLNNFKYLLNVNIEHEYAASIDELSLWYDDDGQLPGGDQVVIGGYENIAIHLATGLDIRLNSTVTEIDYSRPASVVVKTDDGMVYTAQRAIVTLPIGVLQSGRVSFNPTLPSINRKAIASMGSGLLNKCVMVFESVFWGTRVEFLERIARMGTGAWEETFSLVPATQGQAILVAFNAARYAQELESESDSATVSKAMAALRTVYPDAPDPIQTFVTRWMSDPFSLGSYSYTTPKMEFARVHKNVGSPVAGGRIRFAGEHTDLKFPATVHGAYSSGIDAACHVVKDLQGRKTAC